MYLPNLLIFGKIQYIIIKGCVTLKYILWDIDGTLIKTGRAGLKALEQAMFDLYGEHIQIDFSCAGRTDYFIAGQLVQLVKNQPVDAAAEIPKILKRYQELLPDLLSHYKPLGAIMPNVIPILEYLHNNPDYTSVLLTGNLIEGARAKMRCYGLDKYFSYELSGFGDQKSLRNEIARECLEKIRAHDLSVTTDDLLVIGDTLHDIECADHIGVRCLAVATNGTTSMEALAQANPWHVCKQLPPAKKFAKLLSL